MPRPQLSVLMPSYQHERFLPRAVESVLSQSFTDLELIAVDDGSTDGSAALLQFYARLDPRMRCVLHDRNLGIARTFNDALALARGEHVAILASDDLWLPGKLEKQFEALAAGPDRIVWTEALLVDERGMPTGQSFCQMCGAAGRPKSGRLLEPFLAGYYLFFSSVLLRTEHLRGLGFDEGLRYANDVKLALELARRHEFLFLPEPLACHRRHASNASLLGDRQGWQQDAARLREYYWQEFGELLDARPDLREPALGFLRRLSGG